MKAPLIRAAPLQTCSDTDICLLQTGCNTQQHFFMFISEFFSKMSHSKHHQDQNRRSGNWKKLEKTGKNWYRVEACDLRVTEC